MKQYKAVFMYRDGNGELQTDVQEIPHTSKAKAKEAATRTAKAQGWRLFDFFEVKGDH